MAEEFDAISQGMMAQDIGPAIVASKLAPQLGSDKSFLKKGSVDMRRLSVIKEDMLGMLLYAKIRSRKSRVWEDIRDELLNLYVSVGGRGRRDIIRMEIASKGGGPSVESEIQKPGWFRRNITDRSWREKEMESKGI